MKKIILPALTMAFCLSMSTVSFTSCSDDNNPSTEVTQSEKEQALQKAAIPYVNNTVLPTYTAMADAAIELYDDCETIKEKFAAGTLTTDDVKKAGEVWKTSRKQWELSEAFLFGPATNHNIDPHIDSWPLDKSAMDDLLKDIKAGKQWSIDNNGGYGLLGYHSIEYVLFELSEDGNTSHVHSIDSYTPEILEYLVAVAEDLRNQCVLLEACWKGTDGVSEEKQKILEDAELGFNENYSFYMLNAGQAGSIYKTYQEVAEEIISGCVDIADEVGNTKMGKPHQGGSDENRNYIESPYSLNSIEDFQDNIRSIKNSYEGIQEGDACISDYIKTVNPTLDTDVRNAIQNAIDKIGLIPEPFTKNAQTQTTKDAIDACNALMDQLNKVNTQLGK